MSNSKYVVYTNLSPMNSGKRNHQIDTISIHCMAGNLSIESCGNLFHNVEASSNYGIGSDGRVGLYVDEANRSWCTSSASNDHRAITIEVANDGGADTGWHVSDKAYNALIDLLVDICQRNGIKKLLWKADKSLIGQVDKQNMTVHRWFANKACPGDYLYNKHYEIAELVNKRLNGSNTPEEPEKPKESTLKFSDIQVGSIYKFKGDTHYISASAKTGSPAKGDRIKITKKYLATSAHPVCARSVDKNGNFISGVYGWIDLADIEKLEPEFSSYKIRVTATVLNIRSGPSTNYQINGQIRDQGIYTIVAEENGWGKLKSGAGWIYLGYTKKV